MSKSLLWIVPEQKGGIASYAQGLWPAVETAAQKRGWQTFPPITPDGKAELFKLIARVAELKPSVIHIQHEYGLFGHKYPPRYFFPKWIRALKKASPDSKIVVTMHSVIPSDFQYPVKNRGWQTPLRVIANSLFVPSWKKLWRDETYRDVDLVIVHSGIQVPEVTSATKSKVEEIPHYVAQPESAARSFSAKIPKGKPWVTLFGFLSPEKGQDIAVEAWASVSNAYLILAGGVRRDADQGYADHLRKRVKELALEKSVFFTEFVPNEELNALYAASELILSPFRDTSGSGSITQAFSRGKPVVASDLPLNLELNSRISGIVHTFQSENPSSLAKEVSSLLSDSNAKVSLSEAGLRYFKQYSAERVAEQHLLAYEKI